MLVLVAFAVIAGVKTGDLDTVLDAVAWAVALAVLQYVARRFFAAVDAMDRSTTVTLGSTTLPDCIALMAMAAGIILPVQLGVAAVQTGVYVLFLPAVALFALLQYVALASLQHGWLNVTIDANTSAAEEALGIVGFLVKLGVRLLPVAFGVGIACGLLVLVGGVVLSVAPASEAVAAGAKPLAAMMVQVAAILLGSSAALPVAGYVVFAIVQLVVAFVGRFR